MWVLVCFDLPTLTKQDKRNYIRFKTMLEDEGFEMMQYSLYNRHCSSIENSNSYERKVKNMVPPSGHVRIFTFTDKQFGAQKIFFGKKKLKPQLQNQLSLFI